MYETKPSTDKSFTPARSLAKPSGALTPEAVKEGKVNLIPEVSRGAETGFASPSVFDFRDYRLFLTGWFQQKKKQTPGYSGLMFAKKAGFQAHNLFQMVARGERNLSYETQRGFARALGLKGREAAYFEKLVLFNQARNSEDKKTYFEELLATAQAAGSGSASGSSPSQQAASRAHAVLTQIKDHAEYVSHWYVVAIREMVGLDGFKEDADWIADKLKRRITPKQARQALDLLLKLGLVAREAADAASPGKLVIQHPVVDIDPGGIDFAIRNYHKEYLDLARQSIDGEPVPERDLSSLTLSVAKEDLELLKQRIQEFRKQLNLEFSAKEGARTHTVAVNLQSLVLTTDEAK